MQIEKFMQLTERYMKDPLAVVADKNKNFFWYIQDRLVSDRKGVKIKKATRENRKLKTS